MEVYISYVSIYMKFLKELDLQRKKIDQWLLIFEWYAKVSGQGVIATWYGFFFNVRYSKINRGDTCAYL